MTSKENVVLLGDGFFARGFLHHINYNKFFITQIYKDSFINPQDLMYSLQRNIKYDKSLHFRDFITKGPNKKIEKEIKTLELDVKNPNVHINNEYIFKYDFLVIGLGSQKSLNDWKNQINDNLVDIKDKSVGIVGMGPTGIELGLILSQNNHIHLFDMFTKDNVLTYLSPINKKSILESFDIKNISTTFGKPYVNTEHNFDKVLFCGGSKPNQITLNTKVNNHLQVDGYPNIYLGGDCINLGYPKTAQVAYQQGAYVAKRLNGDISNNQPFEYKHNGSSLNIGDKKVLIEGHNIIPNGVYPDIIIKLYSLFCI
jgi:NADH dehydrogenase FAD-containing subunit